MSKRKKERAEAADGIAAIEEEVERLVGEKRYDEARATIDAISEPSVRLRQLRGLALARLGLAREARRTLAALRDEGHVDGETLGILGRTYMDWYDRTGRVALLRRSRDLYAEGFRLEPEKSYCGINAAAKSALLGDDEAAERFLKDVEKALEIERSILEEAGRSVDYWWLATSAEAMLLRGAVAEAAKEYRRAVRLAPRDLGSHGTTWLQAKRILNVRNASPDERALVARVFRDLVDADPALEVTRPPTRRIRAFALDPTASRARETAGLNEVTLRVPWEADAAGKSTLSAGPVGEYVEVIDHDPANDCFYEPVDLDEPALLAADGLDPAEGDPRFHQQMVFAVAMNVVGSFERALGRRALWSARRVRDEDGRVRRSEYVQRLRVYPHALREANAYYSPERKALLFGYFQAESDHPSIAPGAMIFTCLSHDVIAHEMSHALLDGLHPRFAEATNRDVLAFHEAFADLVALFQHFSHPGVLEHEIARTRSDLGAENLLGQLAQEFGRSIGRHGSLRDAIGRVDERTGEWRRREPDPGALLGTDEPHERGAILVAAVFDAFLSIYRSRIDDLLRIATQGSGILAPGELHPDLVKRLAKEASTAADHVLRICIRALDYCPPVDITFGDYLRALITADVDAVPDDRLHYRLAFVEAFQRRGIYPGDVRTLSEESLVWRPPRNHDVDLTSLFAPGAGIEPEWRQTSDRRELWERMRQNARTVHRWLRTSCSGPMAEEIGLAISTDAPKSVFRRHGRPTIEVHSVRLARRGTPLGETRTDFVIEILQRRRGYLDEETQARVDAEGPEHADDHGDFVLRGGCTLLVDPETCRVRYAINKHILSAGRLRRQRAFLGGGDGSLRATYLGDAGRGAGVREPFAMLHRPIEEREGTS